jgi:hypothetical protein
MIGMQQESGDYIYNQTADGNRRHFGAFDFGGRFPTLKRLVYNAN